MNNMTNELKTALATLTCDEMKTSDFKTFCRANGVKFKEIHEYINQNKLRHGYVGIKHIKETSSTPKVSDGKKEEPKNNQVEFKTTPLTDTKVNVLEEYIPCQNFNNLKKIISSNIFMPIYIYGYSGLGKTMTVMQVCAKLKRNVIRVQISNETCEDDLIGGWRLKSGETVFEKGPILKAMENGYIVLLDEIDRGTNRLLSLQSILEGNGVLIKKTGEYVKPASGFNVIATANTKGIGDDYGKFTGSVILDDAFLERFAVSFKQDFFTKNQEYKIIKKNYMSAFSKENLSDEEDTFLKYISEWSYIIRESFKKEAIDDFVNTRRLCYITKCFNIFGDTTKSIKMGIERFDKDTRDAFISLYEKIDPLAVKEINENENEIENEIEN